MTEAKLEQASRPAPAPKRPCELSAAAYARWPTAPAAARAEQQRPAERQPAGPSRPAGSLSSSITTTERTAQQQQNSRNWRERAQGGTKRISSTKQQLLTLESAEAQASSRSIEQEQSGKPRPRRTLATA